MNDKIIIEKLINQDQSGLSLIIDNYSGLWPFYNQSGKFIFLTEK